MAQALADIRKEIQSLSDEDRGELLRTLVADLDAPGDPDVEKAWLEAAQRRYQELVEGKVQVCPDIWFSSVFARVLVDELRVPSRGGAGVHRDGGVREKWSPF